jgi:hypothetical protein
LCFDRSLGVGASFFFRRQTIDSAHTSSSQVIPESQKVCHHHHSFDSPFEKIRAVGRRCCRSFVVFFDNTNSPEIRFFHITAGD